MTTFFWEPLQGLEMIRREMDRLLEQYEPSRRGPSRSAFLPGVSHRGYPLVNLAEDKDNVYIEALAPGVNPDSIEVTVLRDQVRITGEKTPINPDIKTEAFHRSERGAGKFARIVPLPAEVDGDQVSAEYKNGLLLLTLPKHAKAKPKQIAVKVS